MSTISLELGQSYRVFYSNGSFVDFLFIGGEVPMAKLLDGTDEIKDTNTILSKYTEIFKI